MAETHTVFLFGSVKRQVRYTNPNIRVVETPNHQVRNVLFTFWRVLCLLFTRPRLIGVAYTEAKRYNSLYEQWMRFSRFVPVLLYRPEVFHIQWAGKLDRWVFLRDAYGCKLVLSLRGTQINISPQVRPELAEMYVRHFPKVSGFHAVCDTIKQEVLQFGVDAERIRTIYSVLPETAFKSFRLPKRIADNRVSLVSVGRHHWVKGYSYALAVVKLLVEQGMMVQYTIVAPESAPEDLIFAVHDLGIQDYVQFEQAMAQSELFGYIQGFDVLLLPSLSEGIANVVLEAMALGVPVVCTDSGGMAEVVKSGETGWLVPVRDPEAMALAIGQMMQTPEDDLQRMVSQAHAFVKTEFQSTDSLNRFLELYDDVMV
ncbi:glycosyltransferase family 4 protein [Bizionia hallyeonensis]|uniref:Glycosyltransferase family 4 protein n=1 Tax=Bizionia hallyeonensis TaxID=1123757 RepID=A0ABW0C8B0_9FLAO